MAFGIFGTTCLILGLLCFLKAFKIQLKKNRQQQKYQQQLQIEIKNLSQQKDNLTNLIFQKNQQINNELFQLKENKIKQINNYLQTEKQLINKKIQQADKSASQYIQKLTNEIVWNQQEAKKQKEKLQKEINKLKNSLNAGIEARLREQQKKDKLEFYKLHLNNADLSDVQMLQNLKSAFHKPVVLSKLIWSQYFQKQMTELCDRVLGKKTVCGIYKITNIETQQCYIGQSLDISARWKQHCKCGLGIDAPAMNALYNNMQENGVENFTFELLEECSKEELNEKESFWIQTYQSNKYGFNANKGVVKK